MHNCANAGKSVWGVSAGAGLALVVSSVFLAFGLYHVHSMSGVTEGGVLGMNLLLEHWFQISPAVTNFVASMICYFPGWRLLGRKFIMYSLLTVVLSGQIVGLVQRIKFNKKGGKYHEHE